MEDIILNALCTCFHCHQEIGSLNELLGGVSHECFLQYDEVTFDHGSHIAKGVFKRSEEQENVRATTNSSSSSSSTITQWTDSAIKLLISTYEECVESFSSPQHNKKTVWAKISRKLEANGVHIKGRKCDEKWRNLKKKYEVVRRENEKTGNSTVNWKYFDALHSIY
ncbi:unnamed protein product [Phaedon cochleariae]|uniref:Myb/SANT-like DNA-binding domain-containing protein n=1 Tax=Phaedon cochleariae TaxID=80249 RepID=A0A9N9SDB1_PHACE|nr:unnamed protein product [Phaedon cochleariae]